jgi:hypothetical protein
MSSVSQTAEAARSVAQAPASKKGVWAGRILSGLVVLFLIADAIIKFIKPNPVVEAFAHLGWPLSLANAVGILLLICTAVYVFPQTSVVGAILLTGYLGGAVATHLRAGDPLFSHVVSDIPGRVALAGTVLAR